MDRGITRQNLHSWAMPGLTSVVGGKEHGERTRGRFTSLKNRRKLFILFSKFFFFKKKSFF